MLTAMTVQEPIAHATDDAGYSSHSITAQDGLRLHVRVYGRRRADMLPLVCLAGLTRNSADFHALATALACDPTRPRRVIALDYRGRGRSEYDRNPANYSLPVELSDVIALTTALDAIPAVFVGTSRGGILTMLLAAIRPGRRARPTLSYSPRVPLHSRSWYDTRRSSAARNCRKPRPGSPPGPRSPRCSASLIQSAGSARHRDRG